jgi:hypothetical protein
MPDEVVDYSIHQRRFSNDSRNGCGVTVGGGLEFRAGHLRFSPEFRYTRWNGHAWGLIGSGDGYYFNEASRNQFDTMFGILF